jgi:hypothetical protein
VAKRSEAGAMHFLNVGGSRVAVVASAEHERFVVAMVRPLNKFRNEIFLDFSIDAEDRPVIGAGNNVAVRHGQDWFFPRRIELARLPGANSGHCDALLKSQYKAVQFKSDSVVISLDLKTCSVTCTATVQKCGTSFTRNVLDILGDNGITHVNIRDENTDFTLNAVTVCIPDGPQALVAYAIAGSGSDTAVKYVDIHSRDEAYKESLAVLADTNINFEIIKSRINSMRDILQQEQDASELLLNSDNIHSPAAAFVLGLIAQVAFSACAALVVASACMVLLKRRSHAE